MRGPDATPADELADPVEVVDPDPGWAEAFGREAARLAGALAGHLVAIEHIGSTAVEGLAAKPVIDVMVGVRSLEPTPQLVAALAELGYEYVPELEAAFPRRRYFRRVEAGRRTHQVHLVARSDADWWDRHVAFRDWLRAHPDDRDAYAALKRELAAAHRDDREAYTAAKDDFVARVVAKATGERAGAAGAQTAGR